jgi:hypothetical protein
MDHRASFGKTLFGVKDDNPDPEQVAAMRSAKRMIFDGLRTARRPPAPRAPRSASVT